MEDLEMTFLLICLEWRGKTVFETFLILIIYTNRHIVFDLICSTPH